MKKRLDELLCERGLAPDAVKAQAIIMSGRVYISGQKLDKPGESVDSGANIEVRDNSLKYVSRGGLKLEKALKVFPISPKDKVCMDIGASTGGFTDCMLKNGARKVYSIDVGYGQLAWELRTDIRVINLERTNARYITREQIGESVDFVCIDVSFISLGVILPAIYPILSECGDAVCLVKPQFEAKKTEVGKNGVVRDGEIHKDVIERVADSCERLGFSVLAVDFSPIKGPKGNIEYLLHIRKENAAERLIVRESIAAVVSRAEETLN